MTQSPIAPNAGAAAGIGPLDSACVEAELTQALYGQTRSGLVGVAVITFCMAGVLVATVGTLWAGGWLGSALVLLAWRAILLHRHRPEDLAAAGRWRVRLMTALACSGLGWGTGAALPVLTGGPVALGLASFIASGFVAGGAVTMGVVPSAYRWFALATTVPVILAMAARSDESSLGIAGMICGFTFVMMGIAGGISRIARRDVESRLSNQQLVASLRASAKELERSNAELACQIDARNEAEHRIAFLAHHDALTGLPNRVLLGDRFAIAAAQARRNNRRVAVMFLDLDNFKTINDTLGHGAGDEFLCLIAQRLRNCLRASDTISRQGGDEFVMLLSDVRDAHDATRAAEKVLGALCEPGIVAGQALAASGSIGISIYPDDGTDFEDLLQQADTAMYQAKSRGRNAYCCYSAQMNAATRERTLLLQQLRAALCKGEFLLHYQPQVDLDSGRIVGIEALIRWNNADLGLVSPGRFIPIAEESGLIVPIGEWVLEEACRQAADWYRRGLLTAPVAVNVSALQFVRDDLTAKVAAALAHTGLPAHCLELELTESTLARDTAIIDASLQGLAALGVSLAIDDFGTGYSSLAYLKRFKVDRLKIDQSFVRDANQDADDAAIVRAMIQMARSLKITTVAEGVETDAQRAFLHREGCDEAQGYLFRRPQPAADLESLLAAGRIGAVSITETV